MDIKLKNKMDCTGCGACATICPQRCIDFYEDEEGFKFPHIDNDICLNCGKCIEVCNSSETISNLTFYCYAAWSKDNSVRKKSSSGGAFYEIAKSFIEAGGIVYGAAYCRDFSVSHKRIDRIEDLHLIMGAKYVQSNTVNSFDEMIRDIKNGKQVLYSGTPCQVTAAKALARQFGCNIFGVSIICHGVPSPLVWEKYLYLKKGQYAEDEIKDVSFRDKSLGWSNFQIRMDFTSHRFIEEHDRDLFMQGFLSNLFLREACYRCEFKEPYSDSDIVLGDFWGIDKIRPEIDSYNGVSAVIVKSLYGNMVWKKIMGSIECVKVEYEQIDNNNSALKCSVPRHKYRDRFFKDFSAGLVEDAIKKNIAPERITDIIRQTYYYPIIKEYLRKKVKGFNLYDQLKKYQIERIVLYGVTDILSIALEELDSVEGVQVVIGDKNAQRYKGVFKKHDVITIDEIKKRIACNLVDAIIICNPLREKMILDEMRLCGICNDKIYSFISLLGD